MAASDFLPAGYDNSDKTVKAPAKGDDAWLSPQETEFWQRGLRHPEAFPQEFWTAVIQKVALDGQPIPRSQVQGLTQFSGRFARVDTGQTRSSGSYGDLATVGPELTELADGTYVFFFGCRIDAISVGDFSADVSIQVNSTAAVDADAIHMGINALTGSQISSSRAVSKTIANNNNSTVTVKYKSNGVDTLTFADRWLIGLKVGN